MMWIVILLQWLRAWWGESTARELADAIEGKPEEQDAEDIER